MNCVHSLRIALVGLTTALFACAQSGLPVANAADGDARGSSLETHQPTPRLLGTATLSKAVYADKTLAGIIGEVGGFLSGYEFSSAEPYALPDEWFEASNGPYAGSFKYWTPPGNTADYVRYLGVGRVRGQDNHFTGGNSRSSTST